MVCRVALSGAPQRFYHARIFDCDGTLISKTAGKLNAFFVKRTQLLAIDREGSDQADPGQHRDRRKGSRTSQPCCCLSEGGVLAKNRLSLHVGNVDNVMAVLKPAYGRVEAWFLVSTLYPPTLKRMRNALHEPCGESIVGVVGQQ